MTSPDSKNPNIAKSYEPGAVETRIYEYWVKEGYFTPDVDVSKEPFVVIMPPPNVTGELHMGHALTTALEDLMVRWQRMLGKNALFLPGTDHAGIATQVVVERMLANEGLNRHDLGREQFVERVWKWVDQYGNRIYEQLKRLGASCDWSRKSFTLDPGPSKAVRATFVNLYNKGLIYRGERMTNWCSRCRTALSDLEVKYREENAAFYHIRYLLEGSNQGVTIATTRPETLLGDTAVAVNPSDERYSDLAGGKVTVPVVSRVVPLIVDDAVDPEVGTGALKITPGHDPTDFEIGRRHNLPTLSIMDSEGRLNENAGSFQGQTMAEARNSIIQQLEQDGLLERTEPYRHSVGHCDRCDETVEPIVSNQWWMKMEPLAKSAREVVSNNEIQIVPERFSKVYFNWMDNIRDWCVSRQLWWGHRIPVWYCRNCSEVIVNIVDPVICTKCDSDCLEQDPDVLDTWFSSALWPHSTLGWPDKSDQLKYFYPSTVMETGHDILFFWVARMIMMGIENTGQIPFKTIYLHGLVRDPEGIKMSKSRGNVMDPLDLIDIYGADALRFALTGGNSPGNDMRLNEQKIESSRNFANKLWNAARFVLSNIEENSAIDKWHDHTRAEHRHDRWILSRLNAVVSQVNRHMKEYQFGEAQRVLYEFMWNEYCDWYIELAKIRMKSAPEGVSSPVPILVYVLERMLRLLHPFMPFITEEIWGKLVSNIPAEPACPEALIIAQYPTVIDDMRDNQAETEIGLVIDIVRSVRNLRAEFKIEPKQKLKVMIDSASMPTVISDESVTIKSQAGIDTLDFRSDQSVSSRGDEVSIALQGVTLTVSLGGVVDIDNERSRLESELDEIKRNIARLEKRLRDEDFLAKAPTDVVDRERDRLNSGKERSIRIEDLLNKIS
ncbi:MAG: valine--tRNA ligase [Chloroflexota bacterium]|nr:valine--tRNA ligase [Chloroflexota bacterium]